MQKRRNINVNFPTWKGNCAEKEEGILGELF